MTVVLASFGVKALWLLYLWLLGAIVASYISGRKGYGERSGLATGLLLSILAVIPWLLIPAKDGSDWKRLGVFGTEKRAGVE
jgi:hypothetical protein